MNLYQYINYFLKYNSKTLNTAKKRFLEDCNHNLQVLNGFVFYFGGEGGIRTLEASLHPPNRLAGGPFRPLKHLSLKQLISKQSI
jgi:hypothetical protein